MRSLWKLPVGLVLDDFGEHLLSLSPSSEDVDHLLDPRANDSPDDHAPKTCGAQGLRLLAESAVSLHLQASVARW